MDKFALYKVSTKYIKYLRQHDRNVCDPKDFGHTRPYVGILVYESNDFYWFAPLTSKTNKPKFYCVKLYDTERRPIASVRINNLIPICKNKNALYKIFDYTKLINSKDPKDKSYGALLELEVKSMNEPSIKIDIYTKAKMFLNEYWFNQSIRKISNNFPLLEEKALEFSLSKDKKKEKVVEQEEELVR